jgi:hypothetical protein
MRFLGGLIRDDTRSVIETSGQPVAGSSALRYRPQRDNRRPFPQHSSCGPKTLEFRRYNCGGLVANTQLLSLQMEKARKRRLMARVIEQCTEWNSDAPLGFEHCKSFFERTCEALTGGEHESRFVASDAIGLWLVWEILDRAPASEDERKLARTTGVVITREFFNWWHDAGTERLIPPPVCARRSPRRPA